MDGSCGHRSYEAAERRAFAVGVSHHGMRLVVKLLKPRTVWLGRLAVLIALAMLASACQGLDQDLDGDGAFDDLLYISTDTEDGGASQITAEACRGEIDVSFSATDVSFLQYRPDDGVAEPEYTITSPEPTEIQLRFEAGSWTCRFDASVSGSTTVFEGQTITVFALGTGFGEWENGVAVDVGSKIYKPEEGVPALTLDCLSDGGHDIALPQAPEDPVDAPAPGEPISILAGNPVPTANGNELWKYALFDYKEKLADAGCTERGPLLSAKNENGNWVDTYQLDSRFRFMDGDNVLPTYSTLEQGCFWAKADAIPDLVERGLECDTDKDNNVNGLLVENGQEVLTTPIDPTSVLVPIDDSGLSVDLALILDDIGAVETHAGTRYMTGLRNTETGEHAGLLVNYGLSEGNAKWALLLTDASNKDDGRALVAKILNAIKEAGDGSDTRWWEEIIAIGAAIALGDGDIDVIAVGEGFVVGYGNNVVMNGEVQPRNVVPISTVTGSDANSNSVTMERYRMTVGANGPGSQKPLIGDDAIDFVRTYANLVGGTFGRYTTFTASIPNPMQTPRGSEAIDQITFRPLFTPDGNFDGIEFTSREVGFKWETRVTRNPLVTNLTPRAEAGFSTTFSLDDSSGAATGDIEQYKAWAGFSKRFFAAGELQLYYDPETETVSVGGKASTFGASGEIALDADTRYKKVSASTSTTVGGKIPFVPLSISFDLGSYLQNEFWTRIGPILFPAFPTGTVTITDLPTLTSP